MKNFKFLGFVLICMVLGLASCKPETDPIVTKVFGTIFDASTGEPASMIEVTLYNSGGMVSSYITGNDGIYEFEISGPLGHFSEYTLRLKSESWIVGERVVTLQEGASIRVDITIDLDF